MKIFKFLYVIICFIVFTSYVLPTVANAKSSVDQEVYGDISVEKTGDYAYSLHNTVSGDKDKIIFNDEMNEGTIFYEDGSKSEVSINTSKATDGSIESAYVTIDGEVVAEMETETSDLKPKLLSDNTLNKAQSTAITTKAVPTDPGGSSSYKFIKTYKMKVNATKKTGDIATIILGLCPGYAVPAAIIAAISVLKPQKKAYVKISMYYNKYASVTKQIKKKYYVYKNSNYTGLTKSYTSYEKVFN
ncbi:VCBS repeat-containing protein [Streptohalobacillus salinus]|uniref:VCBS repeat-containing protein n=1 Tax=Streptohalobacillus salinus TaxID=621096 RepID=A0A2V3W9W5_9BACI|nr:VCBS domain-containing protein [Streptohalobacillus salinus]PXW89811.1 VCBS repeat-containing protein [Streptohalobacillus salinus]